MQNESINALGRAIKLSTYLGKLPSLLGESKKGRDT